MVNHTCLSVVGETTPAGRGCQPPWPRRSRTDAECRRSRSQSFRTTSESRSGRRLPPRRRSRSHAAARGRAPRSGSSSTGGTRSRCEDTARTVRGRRRSGGRSGFPAMGGTRLYAMTVDRLRRSTSARNEGDRLAPSTINACSLGSIVRTCRTPWMWSLASPGSCSTSAPRLLPAESVSAITTRVV